MDISASIKAVTEGTNLPFDTMSKIMEAMMRGEISEVQIAAFLVAMRMKGETTEEIAAAATIMRDFASSVNIDTYPLVDTCGTGGDGSHTFNISTAAAVVVAACGGHVAKHILDSIFSYLLSYCTNFLWNIAPRSIYVERRRFACGKVYTCTMVIN